MAGPPLSLGETLQSLADAFLADFPTCRTCGGHIWGALVGTELEFWQHCRTVQPGHRAVPVR